MKNQESFNNYHHSMECNFTVKTIFNDKNKHFSRENKKLQKKSNISKLRKKTDVKLLSIDKYVANLLSKLAMNSFKSSSIAH